MRWLWPICKTIVWLFVLLTVYFAIEMSLAVRGVPSENVRTFNDFLAWRSDATEFYVTETKPPQLIALGRFHGLAPSGPAAYVFDEFGSLSQYELETGEGGPVTKLLNGGKKSLTRAEAKSWLEGRGR